jgi:hypothetical protein
MMPKWSSLSRYRNRDMTSRQAPSHSQQSMASALGSCGSCLGSRSVQGQQRRDREEACYAGLH